MKTVKIAICRFYNAKFIRLTDKPEIVWQFEFLEMQVVARLSKTTTLSKWGPPAFELPDKQGDFKGIETMVHPGSDKYPADLYFEVMVYKGIEVSDEIAASLVNEDLPTRDELLKQFSKYELEMKGAIHYGAGMLGLRVHPELVSIPIFEVDQRYLFINDNTYAVQAGFVVQVRDTVSVFYDKEGPIQHSTNQLQLNHKRALSKSSECLSWLLRGWGAEDYVLRFISFFTALESILPGYPHFTNTSEFYETRQKLFDLVGNSALKEIDHDLYLFREPPRVELAKRFKKLLEQNKFEEVEKDVADFKKYCKIRNELLHKGDPAIDSTPHVDNDILKEFEIFVLKHVRILLYGKMKDVTPNYSRKAIVWYVGNFKQ
jgi:hypothetical protein